MGGDEVGSGGRRRSVGGGSPEVVEEEKEGSKNVGRNCYTRRVADALVMLIKVTIAERGKLVRPIGSIEVWAGNESV